MSVCTHTALVLAYPLHGGTYGRTTSPPPPGVDGGSPLSRVYTRFGSLSVAEKGWQTASFLLQTGPRTHRWSANNLTYIDYGMAGKPSRSSPSPNGGSIPVRRAFPSSQHAVVGRPWHGAAITMRHHDSGQDWGRVFRQGLGWRSGLGRSGGVCYSIHVRTCSSPRHLHHISRPYRSRLIWPNRGGQLVQPDVSLCRKPSSHAGDAANQCPSRPSVGGATT
ncbi:hypothetical protein F4802DRAFT_307036 [Xylaria palmicola]|nr:hypothetical protein F4802DRAFT_307036 [Xylaria palmicola]